MTLTDWQFTASARMKAITELREALLETALTLHDGGGPAHHPTIQVPGGARAGYRKFTECTTAICEKARRLCWPDLNLAGHDGEEGYYMCPVCEATWRFTGASKESAREQFDYHREALGHNYMKE